MLARLLYSLSLLLYKQRTQHDDIAPRYMKRRRRKIHRHQPTKQTLVACKVHFPQQKLGPVLRRRSSFTNYLITQHPHLAVIRVFQVVNGGVLSVAEGATATFVGTAHFQENYVQNKELGGVSCGEGCTRTGRGLSYIIKKGGAIHNKVHGTLPHSVVVDMNMTSSVEERCCFGITGVRYRVSPRMLKPRGWCQHLHRYPRRK